MEGETIVVAATCIECDGTSYIPCGKKDYFDWKANKGPIQNLMGYLPIYHRELLISGWCSTCFDEMFGEEAEEQMNIEILEVLKND